MAVRCAGLGLLAAGLVPLGACAVVDAPDTLEELVVYGFVHFDEDERYLRATGTDILPMVDEHAEDLVDGLRVDELDAEDLSSAGVTAEDVTGIVGAMGQVDYDHRLVDVLELLTRENTSGLFETIPERMVVEQTDRDCFLAKECPSIVQQVEETALVPLLGEASRTYTQSARWVRSPDLPPMAIVRTLSPDPTEIKGDLVRIHQQYAFVVLWEEDDAARRVESFWVDAEVIGLDVPESYAVDLAVKAMGKHAARVDEILTEEGR